MDAENFTFEIEGETWRATTTIGQGRDLTDKEQRVALKYLGLRSLLESQRVLCACPERDELPVGQHRLGRFLPLADIHHFKRLTNGKRLHQLKEMALANHNHNSQIGKPPVVAESRVVERENVTAAHEHPSSFQPTSRAEAMSGEMFPGAVRFLFHPLTGRLRELNDEAEKDWVINVLPDEVGLGRATSYAKYVHEWVVQGYVTEMAKGATVYLVRTGKRFAPKGQIAAILGLDTEALPTIPTSQTG